MILHLDLSTGASGDKLLGALLEAGEELKLVSFAVLASKVRMLLPQVEILRNQVERGGVRATHITVTEASDPQAPGNSSAVYNDELRAEREYSEVHELEFGRELQPEYSEVHELEFGYDPEQELRYTQGSEPGQGAEPGSTHTGGHAHRAVSGSTHVHGATFGHSSKRMYSAVHELELGLEPEHAYSHVHELEFGRDESLDDSNTHRSWKDIRRLIETAATKGIVSVAAAERAIKAFLRVAEAEAKVHGVAPDDVHFHEVGAADSIVDILFSSYILDKLSPSAVYATPLALGQGTVTCEHGELPVPAPATAEILANSNVPVYASCHEGELTTPTGAALIAEFVTEFAPLPCSHALATGYGAGSREIPGAANTLRVLSADPAPLAGLQADTEAMLYLEGVTQLACNLDHLSAEATAFACEELLSAGALDVWQEPVTMKKGRLATKLVVLTRPEQAATFAEKIIEQTGSLGVRSAYLERIVVNRNVLTLKTPYGPMPYKIAEMGSPDHRIQWLRPEHDSVVRLAREQGLEYLSLYEELQELAQSYLNY